MVRAFKEEFAVGIRLHGETHVHVNYYRRFPRATAHPSYQLRRSVEAWLERNTTHGWRWRVSTGELFFKDQNDAFAFRMRW